MSLNCSCNMNEYLKDTGEKLRSGNYSMLHVVLGNESCDLDSAVCALVYAAFLHWQHQKMKCRVCTRSNRTEEVKDDIFVPILNVPREDYPIKTEVVFCFTQHNIQPDNILFQDEPNLRALTANANVILVDHHVLSARDTHLASRLTELIDHRPLAGGVGGAGAYSERVRTTVELVGSCATLVAQRIRDLSALFASEVDFFVDNLACTDMLHSTIILDTVNFSKEVNKGTPRDEEVVAFLETVLRPDDCQALRVGKLWSLVSARGEVSALSAAQLLRMDVKELEGVLVPTLPLLVQEFLSRGDACAALAESHGRGARAACVLLGVQLAAPARRDLAVYSTDDHTRDTLCAFLLAWQPSFELSEDTSSDRLSDKSIRYFSQGNLSASRKQYIPALNAFISKTHNNT